MTFKMAGLVTGLLALAFTACAEQVSAPDRAASERAELVQRVRDLHASVAAAGGMTADHLRALEGLKKDVADWQLATGRTDMGFLAPSPVSATDGQPTNAETLAAPTQPGGGSCGPCVPVVVMGDLICFIEVVPPCINGKRTGKCLYACFFNLDQEESWPIRR
ncbi:MAG: hypothetical protein IPK85_22870 [Gemmatimonadetes bacterium]|nr:hypothetical protein [Gemmatimonadota bacterium]